MSARVVPGPDGHTCTLRSAGLRLACSYESPEVRDKERNMNREHSRFCPQVSGLKKKERKRKALNTSPGEPCKFRNSSFANSKGTGGKLTQLVWPLCLLPTPFLGPRSCAAGASCHRERQGLQRQRGKGSIQGRLVLPVWDSPQKRDNKCRLQRRTENVTVIHLLRGTFDRQLFLLLYVHPLPPPVPAHLRGFFILKTYKIGITSNWMKQRVRLNLGLEKYPLNIIWKLS